MRSSAEQRQRALEEYREAVRLQSTAALRWDLSCNVPDYVREILQAELAVRKAGKREGR